MFWALFGAPLVALLATSALAQVRQGSWTPVAESFERGYSSISYWTYRDDGVEIGGGRISVEHGKPQWPESLGAKEHFDAATIGKMWRLGNNKWTTLDTQLPIEMGGRKIEPGIYYLVLERPTESEWRLLFVSPEAVAPHLIDAWAVQARPGELPILFSVPMRYSTGEKTKDLDITLGLEEEDMSRGWMRIEWGTHRLETDLDIGVVSPTFYRAETAGR
jgi:hypothetical protein